MVEWKDYVVIHKFMPGYHEWHIEIKTGKFAKTVFVYEELEFVAKALHFKYKIISSPFEDLREGDTEFHAVVREILIDVFQNMMKKYKERNIS